MPDHVHNNDPLPPNFRIEQLYIATAIDPADNSEGVCPHPRYGLLIAADKERLECIRPLIQEYADHVQITVTIRRFEGMAFTNMDPAKDKPDVVEVVEPRPRTLPPV